MRNSAIFIGPVVKKEFRQIRRDVRSLVFLLAIPAALLFIYGYALNFDVKHIPLAVLDQEGSRMSQEFIEKFRNTEYFDLQIVAERSRDMDALLDREVVRVALIIPSDFEENLMRSLETPVQVIVDGTNATSASTAVGYIASIVQNFSNKVTAQVFSTSEFGEGGEPLESEVRVWYNPELRSAVFLVPGLMAFIIMVIVVVSTAFSVVREKERGTMEQILVSPLRPSELVLGKMIPYVCISLASTFLVLLLGKLLFDVSIKGNPLLLLMTVILFLVGGLGQGILISSVTRTQQVAFMIAILSTLLPTFVLSGFVFPIRNMPPVIQLVSHLVPARYFLVALRNIMIKGVGLAAFWDQWLFLCGFAAVMLGLSLMRLRSYREDRGLRTQRRRYG